MTKHTESAYAPIERNTPVSWTPEQAFQRFTTEFSQWWPTSTHSIGGKLVKRVVFECRLGGLIYEEFTDGRRFQWGKITAWDPPRCVGFTWHPSQHASEAQDVEVRFVPEPGGTRVVLVSRGWERMGTRAARARRGYSVGWGAILDVFAGRRTAVVLLFAALSHAMTFFLKATGRWEKEVAAAGGRMA